MNELTKEILDSLQKLHEKAEKEGLWFYSTYKQMWFSPKELKEQQMLGRYLWSSENLTLRDPFERVKELELKAVNATKELSDFQLRLIKTIKMPGIKGYE